MDSSCSITIKISNNLAGLIVDVEASLEFITKWLRDSDLTVIDSKTELCVVNLVFMVEIKFYLSLSLSRLESCTKFKIGSQNGYK